MKILLIVLLVIMIIFINPVSAIQVISSDSSIHSSNNTDYSTTSGVWVKLSSLNIPENVSGTQKLTVQYRVVNAGFDGYIQFKLNGVFIDTFQHTTSSSFNYYNLTLNGPLNSTDTLEVWGETNDNVHVQNFQLMYDYDGVLIGTGGNPWFGYTDRPYTPLTYNTILDESSNDITVGIFYDSFSDASISSNWTINGSWTEYNGWIRSPSAANSYLTAVGTINKEAIIYYNLSQESGDALSYLFRFGDTDNFYAFNDNANSNTTELYIKKDSAYTLLTSTAQTSDTNKRWMRVVYNGNNFYGLINETNNITTSNSSLPSNMYVGFRKGGNSGYFDIDSIRLVIIGQYWGNRTVWYDAGTNNVSTMVDINGTFPSNTNYTVYQALNGTDNFTQIDGIYISNQTLTLPNYYQKTDLRIQLNGTNSVAPEISSVRFYRAPNSSAPVNITARWSSVHGWNNSNETTTTLFNPITFNVTLDSNYSSVSFYQDGKLVQSSSSLSYVYPNVFAPGTINISAKALHNSYESSMVYWLLNTTEYEYNGTVNISLPRLKRPPTNQTFTIPGNNTYFFNTTVRGSGWINNTNGTLGCTGACTGIATYPLEFWVRPIDGIVNINTKKFTGAGSAVKIYVNDSLYSTTDLTGSGNFTLQVSGLNPLNISHIKINSTTDVSFFLSNISFNRSYPALYDGTKYFALKQVMYMPEVKLPGRDFYTVMRGYNNTNFTNDLNDIKNNYSFNVISLGLTDLIEEQRGNSSNFSNPVYNQSSLQTLDYMVDNITSKGLYVSLRLTQWSFYPPSSARPFDQKNTGQSYPCDTCLANDTYRDMLIKMFSKLSDRYKNHTNVMFEVREEVFIGNLSSALFYNDAENLASLKAYNGLMYIPRNYTDPNSDWKKFFQWRTHRMNNISQAIMDVIHSNNALMSISSDRQIASGGLYYEYPSRLLNNTIDPDYWGITTYPFDYTVEKTEQSYLNESFEQVSNVIAMGSVPYAVEWNVWSWLSVYPVSANLTQYSDSFLKATLKNKHSSDTLTQDNFGIAGYGWWAYQDVNSCQSLTDYARCWGFKYANDTYTPIAPVIAARNQIITIISSYPSSPITSIHLSNQSFNITINKASDVTWRLNGSVVKTESSVITSYYNNSTAGIGNYLVEATVSDGIDSDIVSWDWNVSEVLYVPPTPTNIFNISGNFWINTTWQAGTGNVTDSYNVSVNGIWTNGTTNYYLNSTLYPHAWQNITIQAFNTSGTGSLNNTALSQNTRIPNNAPVQNTTGSKSVNENTWLNFSINSTDADGDVLTYATTATKGSLTGNNFSWLPNYNDSSTYVWNFSTTDNYSASTGETITITVNNQPLTITAFSPASDPSTINGTLQAFSVTVNRTSNITWTRNGTLIYVNSSVTTGNYNNSTAGLGIYNITASITDNSDNLVQIWNWTVNEVPISNPNITSWCNAINGCNKTALTLNVGNNVAFNVSVNQTPTSISWKRNGVEIQNSSSVNFSNQFNAIGIFNITTIAFNANGGSQIVYTVVTVVSGGGGSGTQYDYLDGVVRDENNTVIDGATVSTALGSVVTIAGGYNFGYLFVNGTPYWINISKSGYISNNTNLSFFKDHMVFDGVLTYIQPITYNVSGKVFNSTGGNFSGVTITYNGYSTISNSSGNWNALIPNQTITFTASISGNQSNSTTVTVNGVNLTNINFTLDILSATPTPATGLNITGCTPMKNNINTGFLLFGILLMVISSALIIMNLKGDAVSLPLLITGFVTLTIGGSMAYIGYFTVAVVSTGCVP